jgi:hypothetical protein
MAPRKLYGMPLSPNVVRVATVLNEKGLDFEIVPVDLRTGAHKQPEFLALNVRAPARRLPLLFFLHILICLLLRPPRSLSARSPRWRTEMKFSTVCN